MKVTELIEDLKILVEKAGDDIEVDINNSHGTYSKIKSVKLSMWTDKQRKLHKVIEIIHDCTYNPNDSIVENK